MTEELAEELNCKALSVHSHDEATASSEGFMSAKDKEKLDGIKPNANYFTYTLPPASSDTRGGVKIGYSQSGRNYPVQLSDEKMYVNVPWTDTDTVYSHPTSAGNKHIPSGGSSGQYLKWSTSGTAQWVSPANNTATTSVSGFMSAADKAKLDAIPVTISVNGNKLTFTWVSKTTGSGMVSQSMTYTATLTGSSQSIGGSTMP
ncbi:MAG: hypothetical protein K2H70_01880 [Bacteroidales bacterium]|nr:hypothetical protein [Bacteroidales bacterium]